MTGKSIYWNGNQSNDPKVGTVEVEVAGNLQVLWNDGLRQIVPLFVATPQHGWRIA